MRLVDAELELLTRVRDGDEAALRALYERLARNVTALALQIVGGREDAEEVVQDTFVTVHRHAGRFDPSRGSVRAWVYTIARNEARMRLRAWSSRPVADGADVHDPAFELGTPSGAGAAVDRVLVERALEGLPADDVRLLRDAFYAGFSHSELAEREGAPLGTLKSRLRRALLRARDALSADAGRSPPAPGPEGSP
jgi:RNA polymerase sigma-70 factor (ECF subfamily)